MKKKKRSVTAVPFGLAGASIGMGVVGEGLGYAPLTQAGSTTAGFISPAVNISMGGMAINQMRNFKKKKK